MRLSEKGVPKDMNELNAGEERLKNISRLRTLGGAEGCR